MDPFVWDDAKNAENIRRRGIDFAIVRDMDWSSFTFEEDQRYDYGERRQRVFGRFDGKPYCIAIAPRDGTVRVLSVRRMHEKEANRYGI